MTDYRVQAYYDLRAAVEALTEKWERHSRLFVSERDKTTREDWEFAARQTRALLAPAPASETAREVQVAYVETPYDRVTEDDDGNRVVEGLPYRAESDGLQAAATTAEGALAMIEKMRAARPAPTPPTTVQADRDAVADLIERSSLGTPEVKALRATVSDEHAARVVARSKELAARDAGQVRLTAAEWDDVLLAAGPQTLATGKRLRETVERILAARQSDPAATERETLAGNGEPLCEGLAPFCCGNPDCPAHAAQPGTS